MRDILIRAKELIADPANWYQHEYSNGAIDDPATKCFCTLGAIDRAVIEKRGWLETPVVAPIHHAESDPEGDAAIKHLQTIVPGGWIAEFNDSPETTHADVMQLLDEAIEKAPA